MKYTRKSIKVKTCTILFITNLFMSLVVGNLHVASKEQTDTYKKVNRTMVHPLVVDDDILKGQIGNLMGHLGEGYYLEVLIGTPPQKLNVLIDTGSSNLAVACAPNDDISVYFHRDNSSTYQDLGRQVDVPYTQGRWSGDLGRDRITVSTFPNSTVEANIACINEAKEFFINGSNWQGIMGLGYAAIARPDSSVEPFFDSMVQGRGISDVFSVQLCGLGFTKPNIDNTVGGSVIFGGVVPTLFQGKLYTTPIMKEQYYEVVIVDIKVANESLNMDCKEYNFDRTIVDTGTTNLRLPRRVFSKFITIMKRTYQTLISKTSHEMPKDGFWSGKEVLCYRTGQVPYDLFPTVSLTLPSGSSQSFTLVISPQQYLRPVGEDNDDSILDDCFKFGIYSSDSGSVIGAIAMEGFYVVFDRSAKQVKFGDSSCSVVDENAVKSSISGYNHYSGDFTDCAYIKIDAKNKTLTIVGYVFAGICGLCVIPLLVLVVQWQCRRSRCRKLERSNSDANDLMERQR